MKGEEDDAPRAAEVNVHESKGEKDQERGSIEPEMRSHEPREEQTHICGMSSSLPWSDVEGYDDEFDNIVECPACKRASREAEKEIETARLERAGTGRSEEARSLYSFEMDRSETREGRSLELDYVLSLIHISEPTRPY